MKLTWMVIEESEGDEKWNRHYIWSVIPASVEI